MFPLLNCLALTEIADDLCPSPIASSSGRSRFGVTPSLDFGSDRLCCRAEILLDLCGFGGGGTRAVDKLASCSPLKLGAVVGDTVGGMAPSGPGHGTCPQGMHNGAAVHGMADVFKRGLFGF